MTIKPLHIGKNVHTFIYYCLLIFLCTAPCSSINSMGRSVHRPIDPDMPQITTYWNEQSPHYTIKDSHLKEYPIFGITAQNSYQYLIPDTPITFSTNATKKVTGGILKHKLEQLLQEIQDGRTTFTHFDILRKRDFNDTKKCGFMIVKYKQYPFVAKLSIERPETFIDPFCRGIVPMSFFFMAGGSGRHMTGLTRVLNLHQTNQAIALNSRWRHRVKTPRKWFWLPKQTPFFYVEGKNIGQKKKNLTTMLPSVYAVIADAIDTTNEMPVAQKIKNNLIIKLCNDLNLMVDPHEDNFIFQINPITKKPIIVIIDTEHFPTMVGIHKKQQFTGHADFYASLTKKCAQDIFFSTKNTRSHSCWHARDLNLLQ